MPDRHVQPILTDRNFTRVVIGAMLAGILAVALAGAVAVWSLANSRYWSNWVTHSYQVETAIDRYRELTERLETARRGYLLRQDPRFRAVFGETMAAVAPAIAQIGRMTADNPTQQRNVATLRGLADRHAAVLRRSVAMADGADKAAATAAFATDRSLEMLTHLRALSQGMLDEENRLLRLRDADLQRSRAVFYLVLALAGLLFATVAIGSVWVILRYTRDLSRSRAALRGLNDTLEDTVNERTTDLRRANEEIQRFAYIVSHDLRSPLVNVMGFTAELEAATKALTRMIDRVDETAPGTLDPEARDAARIDLPEAIGFIRTSTQKMDRLINAILRLSREGRRPITPEPLDMDALVGGVVDTLRHRIDELGATVVVAPHLPRITSDRLAVEQILANIVENALKYLAPGRPGEIRISGAREGERADFAIADNGRGIDPRDHQRIFDLFRRSGVQDQPGEGIGLAHTRALAYRLGGTIAVDSQLGTGATFRVNLPVSFSGEQGTSS